MLKQLHSLRLYEYTIRIDIHLTSGFSMPLMLHEGWLAMTRLQLWAYSWPSEISSLAKALHLV